MTRGFGNLHESVLVYSKSPINSIEAELSEEEQGKYNQKDEKFSKRGGFVTQPLATKSKDDRPNLVYPICYSGEEIWPDKQWIWGKDRMEKALSKNEIVIKKTGDKFSVRFKQYLKDENGKMRKAKPLSLLLGPFNQAGTSLIEGLFGSRIFSFPKPYQLASKLLNITLNGMELDHDLFLDYFSGSGTTGHAVINLNREDQGKRKYILVEMGDYFDTVLKPRIQKVVYSKNWKNGKPVVGKDENDFNGISHCFKYIRLESYEDTLNNLEFKQSPMGSKLMKNASLKEDYLLNYLLEVETKGSQSLLSVESFLQPDNYQLKVKKPGSDEYALKNVDLLETFNFLIGLRVIQIDQKIQFNAAFKREKDPELPTDQHTKLVTESGIKKDDNGKWWFRKVVGWVPKDRMNPNESPKSKVLIIWRNLTEDLEQDNLMLDEWFNKNRINTRDFEFDTIYVNGSNNLPNLKKEDDNWKVVLIEDEFHKRMWENEGGAVWQS
jgi:adenine-specific DNA-methyltransferase